MHKLYLKNEDKELVKEIEKEIKIVKTKKTAIIIYIIYLVLTAIMLYIVGNLLSDTLTNLCNTFNMPEIVLGIALGFITSIPELITFFESQKHYKNENIGELGVVEATNNLLTSNVLNLFAIQSIGILIYTIFT